MVPADPTRPGATSRATRPATSRATRPLQTYRLQLGPDTLSFADATRLVPYLADLGITELYLSPVSRSRRGSGHGYDVVDPLRIDPELGGERGLRDLAAAAHRHGLGIVLDIVPNHMAASPENPWWCSVLEHGVSSPFAAMFDIDWRAAGPAGTRRVLVPVLGDRYGPLLRAGEIRVELAPARDGFCVVYGEQVLPTDAGTWAPLLTGSRDGELEVLSRQLHALCAASESGGDGEGEGESESEGQGDRDRSRPCRVRLLRRRLQQRLRDSTAAREHVAERLAELQARSPSTLASLDALLQRQPYRLAHWRLAGEVSGYRRFFAIGELVSVRVEDAAVFRRTHRLVLRLLREGIAGGLRIDHIDGLRDPEQYLERLRAAAGAAGPEAGPAAARAAAPEAPRPETPDTWVVVEKVLCGTERLPESWPVAGTTGYEFGAALDRLLVDPAGLESLTAGYADFVGGAPPFPDTVYECKRQILAHLFGGELRRLADRLALLAAHDLDARDLRPSEIRAGLAAVTACLPVYRTYLRDRPPPSPAKWSPALAAAIVDARARVPGLGAALTFLDRVMMPPRDAAARAFLRTWQQLTGAVMAKGVEDGAFYRDSRLLSLNEVGGDPDPAPALLSVAAFHDHVYETGRRCPHGLRSTSTHDSKRAEDARNRIHVLAQMPAAWRQAVLRWREHNRSLVTDGVPDGREEMMFYQTLLGVWPAPDPGAGSGADPGAALAPPPDLADRLATHVVKAAREARVHTSWEDPDPVHEERLVGFARAAVDPARGTDFLADFHQVLADVAFHGAMGSLAMVAIKAAVPGVPDFYQGSETWNLSMVDPDNRRPVDFGRMMEMLGGLRARLGAAADRGALCTELLGTWPDGRVKMYATMAALRLRAEQAETLRDGDYVPLATRGRHAGRLCAFARRPSRGGGRREHGHGHGHGHEHGHEPDGRAVVCVAPVRAAALSPPGTPPLGEEVWADTEVVLGDDMPDRFTDAFTGVTHVTARQHALPVAALLAHFPAALLAAEQP